jgi:ligand-binding SRPBCC domain-containing protein
VSTALQASPERVWDAVKKVDTFRYITRGALGVEPLGPVPERFAEGDQIALRLKLFHVIPAGKHEIRIMRVDEQARRIETNEGGGAVKQWNHVIAVDPDGNRGVRYSDTIEIEAGPLTPVMAGYAHLFYRYRQRRWRRLAHTL